MGLLERGLIREWGFILINFLRTDLTLMFPGCYTACSNNQKMLSILHKELERKVAVIDSSLVLIANHFLFLAA